MVEYGLMLTAQESRDPGGTSVVRFGTSVVVTLAFALVALASVPVEVAAQEPAPAASST